MAIPAITPYPMPTHAPASPLPWRLDPRRAALLIHDMQTYFLTPYQGHSPAPGLLANIARLREHCTDLHIPVIYSAQPAAQTRAERGLLQDLWGPGIRTAAEAAITGALAPRDGDIVITKWRYSAFQRTPLAELLIERGCDQLIVCGVYGHIGIAATATEAFMRDVQPFLAVDAIADFTAADHEQTLRHAAARCAATLTTSDIVHALTAAELLL
ncbi:isochorismatase [Planomonospora sphaerica]|uniref:Isochorismatase n=1 Tax=Planomonospora sphaerica TaxID=161355 RepID=A0A171DIY9_9ACTN|nr:isochorismatase family protein [Planomonospora sphaerica]GAT68836.1 isochorismatase [Planomonospora sphaerica]